MVLHDNEQQALLGLIVSLQQRLSDQLFEVILYGSKARGDSTPDSGIDALSILSQENEQILPKNISSPKNVPLLTYLLTVVNSRPMLPQTPALRARTRRPMWTTDFQRAGTSAR